MDVGPPETLEELVAVSEFLKGKDHNGDGIGDWGFCLTPQPNYFTAFLAPLMMRNEQECASGDCSGDRTGQNLFFDVQSFETTVGNAAYMQVRCPSPPRPALTP